MSSFGRFIIAPLVAAVAVALVWWVVNSSQGWLEKQPWPLSDPIACMAIASSLTVLSETVRWLKKRQHVEDMAAQADMLGLEYHPEVRLSELGAAAQLRVFSQWHIGWNRLSGPFNGLRLEMFDFATKQRVPRNRRSRTTYQHQTVVVIPLDAVHWPVFEVMPRGVATWFWNLIGVGGARFRFSDGQSVSAIDHETLQRFSRRYCVFVGIAERVVGLAGWGAGIPVGPVAEDSEQVQDRFTLPAMRRLAKTSGWRIECNGTHLAFWKAARIVPPELRAGLLGEVTELYRCLAEPARSSGDATVQIDVESFDESMLGGRIFGMVAGAVVGTILAIAVCLPLMFLLPHDVLRYAIFAWPIIGMASVIACAVLGASVFAGFR